MAAIFLPNSHPFVCYSSDMRQICKPVVDRFHLNIVVYVRYYHDGRCVILTTHGEFLQFHLSQGYMVPAPIPIELLRKQESFHIIPTDGPFEKAKYDLLQRFQSDEAVDCITRHRHYTDVICFAFWAHDKYAINTIINNLDEIKRSADFVSEMTSKFLRFTNECTLQLPDEMRGMPLSHTNEFIDFNNYPDKITSQFTPQQQRIMYWMGRGKSAREIAAIMCLSKRTIENHVAALKAKLSVSSKSELIEKSFMHNFIKND